MAESIATFNVDLLNGTAEADGNAADFIVGIENARLAALDPPEAPLPITPPGALKTSAETVLADKLVPQWKSYVDQSATQQATTAEAKERWNISSNAQRQASVDALEPLP
jgi:hypothetical protein